MRSASKEKASNRRSESRSNSKERRRGRVRRSARGGQKRSPSASPITSSHSSASRSASGHDSPARRPNKPTKKQKTKPTTPPSSPESKPRGETPPLSPVGQRQRPKPRKNTSPGDKSSPSLSSVSSRAGSEDDGPHTPPPEAEPEGDEEPSHTAERGRTPPGYGNNDDESQRERRSHSKRYSTGSPISEEEDEEEGGFGRQNAAGAGGRMKRLKKGHKPIKLTIGAKLERSNAIAAFGLDEEDENEERNLQPDATIKPRRQASVSDRGDDRTSPLSEQESDKKKHADSPLPSSGAISATAPDDKANKREELLRQLRAVEEAIARKKATKTAD